MTPGDAPVRSLADEVGLIESLRFAVSQWIMEFSAREYTDEWLVGEAKRCAVNVGTYGDIMQFTGRAQPTSRQRNNRVLGFEGLARGLAAVCLVEGRADFHGLHWCAGPHPECPTPRREPHPVTADEIAAGVALLDEFEQLIDRERSAPPSPSPPYEGNPW